MRGKQMPCPTCTLRSGPPIGTSSTCYGPASASCVFKHRLPPLEKPPAAMAKRKRTPEAAPPVVGNAAGTEDDDDDDDEVVLEAEAGFPKRPARPLRSKQAKDDLRVRVQKQREVALMAQARATAGMAAANMRKAQVLQDQAALALFNIPNEESLSPQAQEYVRLRREEEMSKLRRRIAAERDDEARDAAECETVAVERAAEVVDVTRNFLFFFFSVSMPNEESLSPQAREYLKLRREEEVFKLHRRIAAERDDEARAAECETVAVERAVEFMKRPMALTTL